MPVKNENRISPFLYDEEVVLRGAGADEHGVTCGHCGGVGCQLYCTKGKCQCRTGKADSELA